MGFIRFFMVLAATFAAVTAAPASPATLLARQSSNDCGSSSFVNQSSGGSPTVSDCQALADKFSNQVGQRSLSGGSQVTVDSSGTCGFGAQGNTNTEGAIYFIGNQDAADIINSAIQQFGSTGVVGAEGKMSCQALVLGGNADVNWAVFHT
ncbi:hypothetical protein NA57DRAFT_59812 [Rhizodiscina lignyota]|uniref:Ecp2 effector protein-like domain-containing protein n=1 Tax=Rhizodiscina lignyota TaxID=1504668 RepID=A0A9P4I4X9_9PEZI|nr:hypothetical protein NA57DRAFT_59812 [Rhizodiscina lignyota]